MTGGGFFAYLGGLVGQVSNGLVQSSYSRSAVTATGTNDSDIMYAGGLAGAGGFAGGDAGYGSDARSGRDGADQRND